MFIYNNSDSIMYLNQGSLWIPDANTESKITILPYHYFNFEPYDGCYFFGANIPNVTEGKCTIFFVYGYKEIINLYPDFFFDINNSLMLVEYIGDEWGRPSLPDCTLGTWSRYIDFTLSNGGFAPFGASVSTPLWVAGRGWRFIRGGSGAQPEIRLVAGSTTYREGIIQWENPVDVSPNQSFGKVQFGASFSTSPGYQAQGYHQFTYNDNVATTIVRLFATTLSFGTQEIYLTDVLLCGSGAPPF